MGRANHWERPVPKSPPLEEEGVGAAAVADSSLSS
jgi:hypothetical protein